MTELLINIRLFANLKEHFQAEKLTIELGAPVTAGRLIDHLKQVYPTSAALLNNVIVARNQALVDPDVPLLPEDEIALIPPVGGGEERDEESSFVRLSSHSLDTEEAYRLLEDVNHGGTVIFVGTVREWTHGRQTSHLSYEAYEDMAIRQMRTIQGEIEAQFPGVTTLQWHRVGQLQPLDIAVICGASSPHRDAAFQACRTLIERLKQEVTIWKKESFKDGQSVWQENAKSTPKN